MKRSRYGKYIRGTTRAIKLVQAARSLSRSFYKGKRTRRPPSYSRSTSTAITRRRGGQRKVENLVRSVKKMKCKINAGTTTQITRTRKLVKNISCGYAKSAHAGQAFGMNTLEAQLTSLKFYNPATPGTLTVASGLDGSYSKEYCFDSIYTTCYAKNMCNSPAKMTLYLIVPKSSTNLTGLTAFTAGITNDPGNLAADSYCTHLTDSSTFRDNWTIVSQTSKYVMPGQQITKSHNFKQFVYDPSNFDENALSYQKKYASYEWMCRIEGTYVFDSITGHVNPSTSLARAVMVIENKYVITYDGGINIVSSDVSDDMPTTIPNSAVVVNQPVVGIQDFSSTATTS